MPAFQRVLRRARSLRVGAVLLLLAFCVAAFAPPVAGAGAARRRTAQVSPADGLSDQVARVTWQGFRPTHPDGTFKVSVLQCSLHPKAVTKDCNADESFPLSLTGNQASGVTQANGTGATFIDIQSTARYPALACSHTNPCSLLVYENTPTGFDPDHHLPRDYALVKLDFRQNAADCPPPTGFNLRLETESSAAAALYQWAANLCSATKPFDLDVTNTSSTAARSQFFQNHVDAAVSSLPPQPGEETAAAPKFAVAPLDLTAVVVAYNIVDPVTRHQITDVTLTPRLVARLISDSNVLDFFKDPEFKKLNPHHTFPALTAEPLLRAEQNADTWITTDWLNADPNAHKLLDGKDVYHVAVNDAWKDVHYPTDVFEARYPSGAYLPRTSEEDVAQRLFHSTKPSEGVSTDPADFGFFAVLDLPIARRFALPIAKLTTGVGKPAVTVSDASILAGYKAMTTTSDGFHVEPGAPADAAAWPLTKVDHAMVPTDAPDALKANIQSFLLYAAGPGQETLPSGFVPLPTALSDQTVATAAAESPPAVPPESPAPVEPFSTSDFSSAPADTTTANASPPPSAVAPPPALTPKAKAVKVTTKSAVIEPVLALSPSGAERFALPIIVLLGVLALAFGAVDLTRRKAPAVVASARARAGKASAGKESVSE